MNASSLTSAFRTVRGATLVIAAVTLVACSSDPLSSTNGVIPARIVLTANTTTALASVGDSAILTARVLDADGALVNGSNLRVSFSPAGVLDQVGNFTFRAVRNGTVNVVVEIDVGATGVKPVGYWADRIADSLTIEVRQIPVQIALAPVDTAFTMLGSTRLLKATVTDARGNLMLDNFAPLTWQSSDATVATVDSTGKVRSFSEGVASISVATQRLATSAVFTVRPRLAHTSCMVYAPRRQTRKSCVTLDFIVHAPSGGK